MKHEKTVKHYKTLDSLFLRNIHTQLISVKYGVQMSGGSWYQGMYYSQADRQKPATLYKATDNRWMIVQ